MAYIGKLLNHDMMTNLEALADALLPLEDWIEQKFLVPEPSPPWRESGETLRIAHTGALLFFKGLMRETSGGKDLLYLWREHRYDPLVRHPDGSEAARAWRADRGLYNRPAFDPERAYNVLKSGPRQISRIDFYEKTLPDFMYCTELNAPESADDWKCYAASLFEDRNPNWPGTHFTSKEFLKRYCADLLYSALGGRNPAQQPFREALLIELGQHRRPGNTYTPEFAAEVCDRFMKTIEEDLNHG